MNLERVMRNDVPLPVAHFDSWGGSNHTNKTHDTNFMHSYLYLSYLLLWSTQFITTMYTHIHNFTFYFYEQCDLICLGMQNFYKTHLPSCTLPLPTLYSWYFLIISLNLSSIQWESRINSCQQVILQGRPPFCGSLHGWLLVTKGSHFEFRNKTQVYTSVNRSTQEISALKSYLLMKISSIEVKKNISFQTFC